MASLFLGSKLTVCQFSLLRTIPPLQRARLVRVLRADPSVAAPRREWPATSDERGMAGGWERGLSFRWQFRWLSDREGCVQLSDVFKVYRVLLSTVPPRLQQAWKWDNPRPSDAWRHGHSDRPCMSDGSRATERVRGRHDDGPMDVGSWHRGTLG